jgi:hypothetical protein
MKQCPQCRQTFTDETLFCLSDGTPLSFVGDSTEALTMVNQFVPSEELTVVNQSGPNSPPEELTVVRQSGQNTTPPVQTTQTIQPVQTGVNPIFAYLAGGLFLLLLAVGAVGIGLFAWSRTSKTDLPNTPTPNSNLNRNDNEQNRLNQEKANLQVQKDQIDKEKQRLEDERNKLNQEKNKPNETPIPTPPPSTPPPTTPYPAQPTARIKFGRGRVAESVSGKIYTQRSFVLEARSGQYLSASVGSGGGCVTFSGGGTSLGYVTSSGDNRVTLVNKCGGEAGFTLTVSIR